MIESGWLSKVSELEMESILLKALQQIPGCITAGLARARDGALRASFHDDPARLERLQFAALAASSLFLSARSTQQATKDLAGAAQLPLPSEAVVVTSDEIQVFQRWPGDEELYFISVCALEPRLLARILIESRQLHPESAVAGGSTAS